MAAPSEVDICNLGLNAIGHTQFISSLDPKADDSLEAEVCALAYPQCRDEVLEATQMPFATRRARPAPLDATKLDLGTVPDGWCYAFALPADCLPNGLQRIWPCTRQPQSTEEIPFGIEYDGKTNQVIVLTDLLSPEFIYTVRITDTNRFAPTFCRALSERVGCDAIRGLRKDARLFEPQFKIYSAAEATAKMSGRRAQRPDSEPEAFFLQDRGAGNHHRRLP